MMVDPAVGYYNQTPTGYGTLDRGTALDLWLKNGDGTPHLGVVWPGATVYPGIPIPSHSLITRVPTVCRLVPS
jgi:hypothetical protein